MTVETIPASAAVQLMLEAGGVVLTSSDVICPDEVIDGPDDADVPCS